MVSPLPSWSEWIRHMSSFLVWWQHRMKASCIVQSFTNAGQKTSKIKSSTLIYQLCSVSPPVNFFAAHSGYTIWVNEQRVHVENVLQIADGVEQCIALLCTIVYCSEPTSRYWDTVCPKTLSPGVASRILVTQATATALLSCRNATCGFKIAEPTVQQRLWGAFGICAAQLTFTKAGCMKLPPQELQEGQGLQVQLALLFVWLQLMHIFSLNYTWLRLGVKDESM